MFLRKVFVCNDKLLLFYKDCRRNIFKYIIKKCSQRHLVLYTECKTQLNCIFTYL